MRRLSAILVVAAVFAGCGANLPARTGYDRRTGTWKPAPGSKTRKPKPSPAPTPVAPAPKSAPAAPIPESTPTLDADSVAPVGTKLRGQASFYGKEFVGSPTSSGEPYDPDLFTCAHRTLPFGTRLKVDYPKKGLSTTVRVNDRGPHKDGRILDLSRAAADELGLTADGVGGVEAEVVP